MSDQWKERPPDAPDSWPASELRVEMMRIAIRIKHKGGTLDGTLDDIAGDDLHVIDYNGHEHVLPSAEIIAYSLPESPIDHSNEMRP
jgi:hypothetical protein